MADFARWATACETALGPAGTLAERGSWMGTASELLRAANDRRGGDGSSAGWPKNPGALSGRLRRAQTFLRVLDIEISFSREGRAGTRTISGSGTRATTVSPVSPVGAVCQEVHKENYKLGKLGGL